MGVTQVLALLIIVILGLLISGYMGKITKKKALLGAVLGIVLGSVLVLFAVLPGNSFYGKILVKGNTDKKVVALTFDDGPYPPFTYQILQVLRQKDVPATFFLVGENAEAYPHLVKELSSDGHLLGTHTYHHVDLLKLSKKDILAELIKGKEVLEKITGKEVTYFRPPHGFKDWRVLRAAREENLKVVNWSVLPKDWTNPGVNVIVERVVKGVEPGSIVLLHDGDSPSKKSSREQTVAALPLIIDKLRNEGYTFVTVEELE